MSFLNLAITHVLWGKEVLFCQANCTVLYILKSDVCCNPKYCRMIYLNVKKWSTFFFSSFYQEKNATCGLANIQPSVLGNSSSSKATVLKTKYKTFFNHWPLYSSVYYMITSLCFKWCGRPRPAWASSSPWGPFGMNWLLGPERTFCIKVYPFHNVRDKG